MELFIAAFVVACCIVTIALAMYGLRQETQDPELVREATVTPPQTVGLISSHMAVPRKHPLLRTRSSKALK